MAKPKDPDVANDKPEIGDALGMIETRGLVGMIVAEFFTSVAGLGYMIMQYANAFETAKLFVPIVVVMCLGVSLIGLTKLLERKIAPWQRHTQADR